MNFEDYIKENESTELVRVDEGQLIIAQEIQKQLIDFETVRKEIDKKEKELKATLYNVMRANGVTKYESNDKRIMITLGEDGVTEKVDSNELWLKYPDIYRELVQETPRKGALRITIREAKENE